MENNNSTFGNGLTKMWYVPIFTGIMSLVIGIWCLCSPQDSMDALTYVFCGIMLAAGVLNIAYGYINTRVSANWGWSFSLGLLEIIASVVLFSLPEPQREVAFLFVIGTLMLVITVNAICEACVVAAVGKNSSAWTGFIIGFLLLTLIFTLVFLVGPLHELNNSGRPIEAVWSYIGLSFIFFGIYRFILAGRLKSLINNAVK